MVLVPNLDSYQKTSSTGTAAKHRDDSFISNESAKHSTSSIASKGSSGASGSDNDGRDVEMAVIKRNEETLAKLFRV